MGSHTKKTMDGDTEKQRRKKLYRHKEGKRTIQINKIRIKKKLQYMQYKIYCQFSGHVTADFVATRHG